MDVITLNPKVLQQSANPKNLNWNIVLARFENIETSDANAPKYISTK